MKEERALTNIKLTESDSDGIWLHFEADGMKAGISLKELVFSTLSYGGSISTIQNWARQQLDKQKVAHQRFYLEPPSNELLKEGQEQEVRGRPSPPKEGGY